MKALIAIAIMLLPGAAWAQQTTTVMPFGRGYIINDPNRSIFDN